MRKSQLATALTATLLVFAGLYFCVTGGTDTDGSVYLTIHASAQGWVGFGTGLTMANAVVHIAYTNSTGGVTLSTRKSTGHFMPQVIEDTETVLSSNQQLATPSWARIAFTIKRPLSVGGMEITSTSPYIFAQSSSAPDKIDSQSATFHYHSQRVMITGLDLTTAAIAPVAMIATTSNTTSVDSTSGKSAEKTQNVAIIDSGSSGSSASSQPLVALPDSITYDYVLRVHGIMMFVAWVVSPTLGVFTARYLKDALGVWWFRIHVFLMFVGTGLLTAAAIILVVVFKPPPHFTGDFHRPLGIAIGAGMLLQIVLGITSDRLFSPNRTAVPWWDKAHWWLGRMLIAASVVNVVKGVLLYQDLGYDVSVGVKAGLGAAYGVAVLAFVAGEVFLGQIHHGKIASAAEKPQVC
ncbi:hypothetical protein HK105_206968 [Polyrhizophydium stewartii]|uniref:Cytochrome b561 domain-containing protein n=1 Tax=Polyrhizophydium stewartii TaxID=2732419 RepID=A0ABR4N1U8_9FUNG